MRIRPRRARGEELGSEVLGHVIDVDPHRSDERRPEESLRD